jgi:hypothetical protein
MSTLVDVVGLLAAWQVWLQARLRFSAPGRARRDFRSAVRRLDGGHLWLSRDDRALFSRSYRRVAGVRILIVDRYPMDDLCDLVRAGSAPIATHSYRLIPFLLHVFRRVDLETYTTTGERIDQASALRDIASLLRQISARTIYATPAELADVAAHIRSAERSARKHVR